MTVPNLRRSWARSLFLAALLLYLAPQAVAAIVTGANQPRRAFDGSGGYTYTRILEGLTGAGAIDTLLTDGSGHLVVSTTGTGAVSGTVTANQGTAGASPWLASASAATTTSATLLSAVTATGAGTALSTDGMGSVGLTVSGSGSWTLTWQGTEDGSTWNSVSAAGPTVPPISPTTSLTGTYLFNVAGLKQIRPNVTAYTSGSVTVTAHASPTTHPPRTVALGQQARVVDTNNSTTTPLAGNATFTGAFTDSLAYGAVTVVVKSDQNGSSSGFVIHQSSDGVNDDVTDAYSAFVSTAANSWTISLVARYVKITYTNGATLQSTFRLTTYLVPIASALPRSQDLGGNLKVDILGNNAPPSSVTLPNGADGSSLTSSTGLPVLSEPTLVGGSGASSFLQRGNLDLSLLASAARTALINSPDQTNYNGRGVKIVISITAASGTGGLTFTVKGKDSISGSYYTLLASAAQTATGVVVLTVYPGVTTSANVAASDVLPRTWRVEVTVGDASSYTYSVSAVTIN